MVEWAHAKHEDPGAAFSWVNNKARQETRLLHGFATLARPLVSVSASVSALDRVRERIPAWSADFPTQTSMSQQ